MANCNKVLLIINVSVTGTAAEAIRETKESLWSTYDTRRSGRTFAWSTSTTERTTGETKSIGKFRQTTSWHADSSNSRERVTLELLKPASESPDDDEEEEKKIEIHRNVETIYGTEKKNDARKVKISGQNSTVSSMSTGDTKQKINLSTSRTFIQSMPERSGFDVNIVAPATFDNVSRIIFLPLTLYLLESLLYNSAWRTRRSFYSLFLLYRGTEGMKGETDEIFNLM